MMYEEVKKDMVQAMKDGDKNTVSVLKVLVSDIQRDPHKDYSDAKIVALVKRTVKALYDNHDKYGNMDDLRDAEFLERVYLPKPIEDKDIVAFLDTIDFEALKNKMQAIGLVTKHFPDGSVEGGAVKSIVMNYIG